MACQFSMSANAFHEEGRLERMSKLKTFYNPHHAGVLGRRGRTRWSFMRWCLVRLSLLLVSSLLTAQTSSEIPAPTIRATTRLVLVNVVASDKSGKPVSNLEGNSFKMFESGKPQKPAIFDYERPAASKSEASPPLPPKIFTNRPSFHTPPGPLTMILLDALNTPARDQVYARRKLLSYLQTQLQPGQRLAIFSLGEQLRLLQDFTTDPELLRSAIQGVSPEPSKALSLEDVKAATPPPPREAAAAGPYLRMLSSLKQLLAERGQMSVDGRVATTLSAFRMIARAVAGYPGRKNLIWVSGSFPLAFTMVADFGHTYRLNEIVSSRSYEHDIRETASQMGDAQISIYPVDARGLIGAETVDSAEPMNNELGQCIPVRNSAGWLARTVTTGSTRKRACKKSLEQPGDSPTSIETISIGPLL